MAQINGSNNGSISSLNVKTAQENNDMNANTINAQTLFDNRRQFTPFVKTARLHLTEEQVVSMSPLNVIIRLFSEDRIRVTNSANGTRKDGLTPVFGNGPQWDQMGRCAAMYENIKYIGQALTDTQGYRSIALVDPQGDRDVIVYEKKNPESGWINYSVFYASKQYNQHAQIINLTETGEDPIQSWLKASIEDGYVGFDGVQRESHNAWVRRYNEAVIAHVKGVATPEQDAMLKNAKPGTDENNFVQINSRREVKWESVVNKYALLSWLVLDATKPAFEIYNRAKTSESNERFILGAIQMMERGYRNQLRSLSGLYDAE